MKYSVDFVVNDPWLCLLYFTGKKNKTQKDKLDCEDVKVFIAGQEETFSDRGDDEIHKICCNLNFIFKLKINKNN